jgi:hypothetical protein
LILKPGVFARQCKDVRRWRERQRVTRFVTGNTVPIGFQRTLLAEPACCVRATDVSRQAQLKKSIFHRLAGNKAQYNVMLLRSMLSP